MAGQKERHANIEQRLHFVDDMNHKNKLLEHLLIAPDVNQTIIFTSTKRHADLLAEDLYAAGHRTAALHGDMTQGARNRTLTKLRHGDVKVLVATDVAARGIDVQGISHVINYDLPKFAEDYVHRIGRTGRANNTGVAISFASNADRHLLRKIEQYTGQKLQAEVIAGFEPKRAVRSDDGDSRRGKRPGQGKPQGKGGFRRDDRQGKSFGDRVAREGGSREALGNKPHAPRAPRQADARPDKEVNGNSKSYNKDTDFQFARALADEFGQRRPRPAGNNQERFGNPNANRGNNKPRPAGKSFGDSGVKRPRSFV